VEYDVINTVSDKGMMVSNKGEKANVLPAFNVCFPFQSD